MKGLDERAFESLIGDRPVDRSGYDTVKEATAQGSPTNLDPVRALKQRSCSRSSVPPRPRNGTGCWPSTAGTPTGAMSFPDRVAKEIDARGAVDMLCHGLVDLGVTIRLAYFRPASGLSPALGERSRGNRLTVPRQLPYAEAVDPDVELTYLRLEQSFEGSVALEGTDGDLGRWGSGATTGVLIADAPGPGGEGS